MPKCILSGQVKSTFTQEQADGRYIQMTNGATTTLASSLQVSGINNIEFTEEGEESITASNVSYSNTTSGMTSGNVQNAIDELFQSVSEGKSLIAAAVTDKGVETAATDSFATMAGNIGEISDVPDLSNPGAADDLRSGKQLVGADGGIITGTLAEVTQATPSISVSSSGLITASATQSGGIVEGGTKSATQQLTTQGAATITPGTTAQTAVASGRYTTGDVVVAGDANLVPENIAEGVSIFGVTGTHSGGGGGIANVTLIGVYGAPNNRDYGILSISPSGEPQTIYVAEGETKTIKVAINSYALPMIQGDFDASHVVGAAQTNEYADIYLNNTGHSTRLVYIYGDCTITV